jgi:predicted Zn-dependent protease
MLGNSFAQAGKVNAAAAAYREVMRREPRWVDPYLSLAKVLMVNGETGGAEDLIRRGLAMVPETSMAAAWGHEYLGDILLGRGETAAAAGEFQRAVMSFPYQAGAGRKLAAILIDEGKTDEAMTIVESMLRAYPNSPGFLVLRARLGG